MKCKKKRREVINAPLTGKLIALEDVGDAAFSGGGLGKGIGIIPSSGEVVAPFDGTVVALFPTNHAIGLVSDDGCQVLIHIGVDTVRLEGKYFQAHVKKGDRVKTGDLLVTFDLDKITQEGYNLETPVLVTNGEDYLDIILSERSSTEVGDSLLTVII